MLFAPYKKEAISILYGANKMPKIKGVCDVCNGVLEKRKDDNEDAIKQRINIFNKEKLRLIDFYGEKVIRVNGKQTVEDVFRDIKKALV